MHIETYNLLIINASLLISFSLIFNFVFQLFRKKNVIRSVLIGILAGAFGVILMMNSVVTIGGVIFDTRSILVSVVGLFFGFIPAIISIVIICAYRIFIGGAGQYAGVLVTVLTASVGLLWRYFRLPKIYEKKKTSWLEFYIFGLVTHAVMLAGLLILPSEFLAKTMETVFLPVIIIYPVVAMILCSIGLYIKNNSLTESELKESELRFRAIFEQAPIGIVISDRKGILFCNKEYERILGRTQTELISEGWESYTHKDDLKADVDMLEEVWAGTSTGYSMIKRYIKSDGTIIWVRIFVSPLKFTNEKLDNYLCMISDITQAKKSEDALVESEEEYKKLFHEYQDKQLFLQSVIDSVPDLLFYKDTNGVYMGCNKAFEKAAGKTQSEILEHSDQQIFMKTNADLFRKLDLELFKKMESTKNEVNIVYPSGKTVMLETLRTPFYDSNGNISGLIGSSRDITERKQREEEIVYLNHHDVLTGLNSRVFFDKEVLRLDSEEFLPLSVIIGDINGLKFVNDAFGHAQGDILLVEMSKILTSCCKEGDVISRTGGDEFTILLPKSDETAARNVVDSIKAACLRYAAQADKETYYASISLGFAVKTTLKEPFSSVLKTAEEYMYRHKLLEHKSLHSAIISSIKTTMYEKSNETEEHAERMTELARKFGIALGFTDDELVSLELVTALHDIGKISIDQRILDKPGKLNEKEWAEIKKHPDVGYRIALTVPELSHIAEYILCHHEKWNGSGYPQGLSAEEIPLIARVLTIVDAYDAMTQNRSYRKAMPKEDAIAELQNNAGTQFDPRLTRIFIEDVLPSEE